MINAKNKWIALLTKPAYPTLRLFCFPYSGSGAQVFKPWQEDLPASIQLCGIQYPGRGARFTEAPFHHIEAFLPELLTAIKPFLNMPFAFFGHSLGGAIAFELSRLLQQEGFSPKQLFISGRNAPHLPRRTELLHNLPEPEFRAKLRELGGTSPEVLENPELMELVAPLIRADFTISETYTHKPGVALECPLTAFGGETDPLVNEAGVSEWSQHTRGPFSWHRFNGDHFFLDSHRQELIQKMVQALTTGPQ